MKKRYPISLLFALCLLPAASDAQTILNGSFEDNIVLDDSLMLTEPAFDNTVANCYTVDGGFMDVISSGTYCGGAHDGSFFIQNSVSEYYGAFSMQLSGPMGPGTDYLVTFWSRRCGPNPGLIVVGYTQYDSIIGIPIFTVSTATDTAWHFNSYVFTATQPWEYLYVDMQNPSLNAQMQVDLFTLSPLMSASPATPALQYQSGPNPVADSWSITLSEAAELVWIDMAGKIVLTQTLEAGTTAVDRQDLTAGIYGYRITTEGGKEASGRLVLQ
jgi:hypothetical protein